MPAKKAINKLTKNFSLWEFYCRDEENTPIPPEYMNNVQALAEQLQILRDELNEPVKINSGYRTVAYNKSVGGASKSQHLYAKAADIAIKSKTPKQLKAVILKLIKAGKMQDGGIGLYPSWVHYDIGPVRRW